MSAFGAEAERWAAVAGRMSTSLARDAAEEGAIAFLRIEHMVTPKVTGALADSEIIDSIAGGGAQAVATCSPHKKYAAFRNDGGTISAKDEPARSGKVHASGIPYRHSLAWAGGFAMHVTQAGAHYVQRAESLAPGAVRGAVGTVLDAFLEG